MKQKYLMILGILAVIFVSGCTTGQVTNQPICNKPYILVGSECCLDQNSNNICDKDETQINQLRVFCGDGICQSDESCSDCSQDCGECEPKIKNSYDAVQKIENDNRIINDWEKTVLNANCPATYIDISNSIVFKSRIIISKNIIECEKNYPFNEIKDRIDNYLENPPQCTSGICIVTGNAPDKNLQDYYNLMDLCSKDIIDITSKLLNGISRPSNYPIELADTCTNCDDVWLINIQCPISDSETGISILGTAAVDSKTGKVLW